MTRCPGPPNRAAGTCCPRPGAAPAAGAPAALAAEIAAIFAELLDLTEVATDADVWDLGATSFTMVQVSAALQERHGRQVPVAVLLSDPTPAGIAGAIAGPGEPEPAAAPPSSESSAAGPMPSGPLSSGPLSSEPPAAGLPAARLVPGPVGFFDAAERAAFKQARWDLRRDAGAPLALEDPAVPPDHYGQRGSRRDFAGRAVRRADFARLLGFLRETETDGRPRRLYPSAGDTYAVQVYVHVRPGGVERIPAGIYYYHPVAHELRLVNEAPTLDRSVHFVYNREVYDRAAFEIYLYGAQDAIRPVYGADSERFLLLEAGYLGQLLMLGQVSCGIGLCPVGLVATGPLAAEFRLSPGHSYLHAFLAGAVDRAPGLSLAPLFGLGPADVSAHVSADAETEVAIIGAAGRFPGARDPDELWRLLARGDSAIIPLPAARIGQAALEACRPGGFLDDIDEFDSLLFHVSPQEAPSLDPQLRLLLQTVWECLETAGHTPASLGPARTGVFLGAMWQDQQHVGVQRWQDGVPAGVSATASEAANRISHFFGFQGPSVAVDTSCSSSLTALHLAAESIRRGECDAAVVAAANLFTHPYHLDLLTNLGLVAARSPEGAFDAGTPGWLPGEGAAAVLLRRTTCGDAAADNVLAVVEASRIGHVGAAGRFATPAAAPLAGSVRALLASARLTADDVDYVECAAAGAAMADASEIDALGQVFGVRRAPVPAGTLKPNIGHLEAAAGLSQLFKVLAQFRHGAIAPTVLSPELSPLVSGRGLRLAPRLERWQRRAPDVPLRALVNAVGATGSYGHLILRSPDQRPERPAAGGEPPGGQHEVPLTAATPAQLAVLAGRLHDHLVAARAAGRVPPLADIAYTLQVGRMPLACRLSITCGSAQELIAALRATARGEPDQHVVTGATAYGRTGTAGSSGPAPARGQARIALPTYPFAAERYRYAAETIHSPPSTRSDPGPDAMLRYLVRIYAEVSGIPADRLHPRTRFEDYGLTSIQIAALNARLGHDLGPNVPATLFFEHPDLAGVAVALAGWDIPRHQPETSQAEIPRHQPDTLPPCPQPAEPHKPHVPDTPRDLHDSHGPHDPLAIVGLAGRYPMAPDLNQFWANLLAGRDCVTEPPRDRLRAGWPGPLMTGGYLDGVTEFDPLFFGITPRDAALMDPQERLFLQECWHALESAGYTRDKLRDRHHGRIGVFAASMYNEYAFFGLGGTPAGSAIGGIANRVSYFLDLCGPSLTVDTMCSSSLTALHLAASSLRARECDVAIVGGVNLSLHPNKFIQLHALGMASSGRCRSFADDGDGFVPAEGVGVVVLRPLAAALADGDPVRAVVRAATVGHGGRTNGYTVPNPVAQGELIADALRAAGVPPDTISYVEAHGTGTALGDPVEIEGLGRAFGDLPAGSCAIGSVKSNIGHAEAAAGLAGLTKVILQFEHGTLVPSLHAERLSTAIAWDRSPFRLQRDVQPWRTAGAPLRAGISSFGAGGTNAHVVLESFDALDTGGPDAGPQLIVMSARSPDRLRETAALLAGWLDAHPGVPLADVAWTLQTGREPMRHRLAFVAAISEDACARLARFAAGTGDVRTGSRPAASPTGDEPPAHPDLTGHAEADLDMMARYWLAGGTPQWARLHQTRRRVVVLPGYPFDRMRCWVAEPDAAPEPASQPALCAAPESASRPALYTRTWAPLPQAGTSPAPVRGTVVCMFRPPQRELALAVTEVLWPSRVQLVAQAAPGEPSPGGIPEFGDEPSARRVMAELVARDGVPGGWLDLCALPDPGDAATGRDEHDAGLWGSRLAILQEILARRPRGGLRVMQAVCGLLGYSAGPPDLTGGRLAGFVRSLGAEYPWADADVVDVGPGPGCRPGRGHRRRLGARRARRRGLRPRRDPLRPAAGPAGLAGPEPAAAGPQPGLRDHRRDPGPGRRRRPAPGGAGRPAAGRPRAPAAAAARGLVRGTPGRAGRRGHRRAASARTGRGRPDGLHRSPDRSGTRGLPGRGASPHGADRGRRPLRRAVRLGPAAADGQAARRHPAGARSQGRRA